MDTLRILYFGMDGAFSRVPLAALLDARFAVCGVVVPRPAGMTPAAAPMRRLAAPPRQHGGEKPRRTLPMTQPPAEDTASSIAWHYGIPVFEAANLAHAETSATLARLRPDVICVACFPHLLPVSLLTLPRLGALNLHPSLLPDYRGPAPLFWVFHDGLERAGVTVHAMDAGADTGPIVAQEPLTLPDGITYAAAERRCAQVGASLLVEALRQAMTGAWQAQPQPAGAGSTARLPRAADFVVTPAWSARRAYNFIRGMAAWEQRVTLSAGGHVFTVRAALAYDAESTLPQPIQRHGERVLVQCAPGVLTVAIQTRS